VCIKKWTFSDFCSVAPLWENQGERAHRHSATKEATPYISLSSLSYDHSPLCLTMFFCVACYYHANLLMCHVSCNAVCYVCYVDTVSSWYISLLASVPRITHPSALSTAQHEMCVAVLCLSLKMTSYHGQTCQCRISWHADHRQTCLWSHTPFTTGKHVSGTFYSRQTCQWYLLHIHLLSRADMSVVPFTTGRHVSGTFYTYTFYHGQTCQCRISLTYWSQTDPTDRPIANKNESFFVSAPTWCALMQTHS
jgi:hypothetical protein